MTQTANITSAEVQAKLDESRANRKPTDLEQLLAADRVVKKVDPRVLEAMGVLERGMVMADAIEELERIIDNGVLQRLMKLYNNPLGFLCDRPAAYGDRNREPYSPATVKRCVIEGLLYGVMPIGNEMNIISERCYVTRQGYTRKLQEFEGLTDLRIDFGVPKTVQRAGDEAPSGAVVNVTASWRLKGVDDKMVAEIPVKMNKSMGLDAVIGKADRKIRHRIYCRITGSSFTPEGELDADEISSPPELTKASSAADRIAELRAKAAVQPAAQAPQPEGKKEVQGEPAKSSAPASKSGDELAFLNE